MDSTGITPVMNMGNDGMNGFMGIFGLLILLGILNGGFGGGWNGNGGVSGPAYQSAVTRDTIAYDFDINDLKSSIAANGASIANGFYNLNTGLLTGLSGTNAAISNGVNAIQSDICQQGIAGLQNTNGILQAINANTVAGM